MNKFALGLSMAATVLAGTAWAASDAPPAGAAPMRGWTTAETRAQAQSRAEAMFERMDVNHDGKLDQADRTAHETEMFDRMDTNHDGSISREEFMAAHQRGAMGGPPEGAMGKRDGGHHGMRGPDRDHMGGMMLGMADTNHDGVVTKDEFVAAALKHFDMMDANHDGTVTPAERKAAMAAMRTKWRDRKGSNMAPPASSPGE